MNVIFFTIMNKTTKKISYAFAKTKDRSRKMWVFIEPKEGYHDPIFQEMLASEFDEDYEAVMFREVDLMEVFNQVANKKLF